MGFLLTVIYIGMTVLSPADMFPELGEYRIMLWVGVAALLASVGGIFRGACLRLEQVHLMLAFIVMLCLSRMLNGWFGGVPAALSNFIPVALVFFLIVWNISTPGRLGILSAELILLAIYFVARGAIAYYTGDEKSPYALVQPVLINPVTGETRSYLRIRALGMLNDPNDFAQYLAMVAPLLLTAWRQKRFCRNVVVCLLPAAILIYGVYLTNSRGGLVALALLGVTLVVNKIGTRRGLLLAPVVVLLILALNQSGRAFSLQEGSARARADAWSEGLGMFQESPIWGIGFGSYGERYALTAHNSVVLCLAELGLLGCLIWVGLIVCSVMRLRIFAKLREAPADAAGRWALVVRLALYTSLAAAWFLSRTYATTLYLVLGLAAAVPRVFAGATISADRPRNWFWVTTSVVPLAVLAVYLTVRLRVI